MNIYFLLFLTVAAIFRRRGWLSPAIALGAVILSIALEVALWVCIYSVYVIDGDYGDVLVALYSCIFSAVSVGLLFVVVSRFIPLIDYRRSAKASRFPYRPFAYAILLYGLVWLFSDVETIGRERINYSQSRKEPTTGHITPVDATLSGPIATIVAASFFFRMARRQRLAANRWKIFDETKPPLLYLRSFPLDPDPDSISKLSPYPGTRERSFDELLERATRRLGVMLALGDPGDYLPTPGALKIYPTDDAWRNCVDRLAKCASAVLVLEGGSRGLAWEFSHLRANVDPRKVFLFTLLRRQRKKANKQYRKAKRTDIWSAFRDRLSEAGFSNIGADPGAGSILAFNNEWGVHLLAKGLSSERAYRRVLTRNLPPVSGEFHYREISDVVFTGIVNEDVKPEIMSGRERAKVLGLSIVLLSLSLGVGLWLYGFLVMTAKGA